MAYPGFDPKYPFPDFSKLMEQFKVPGLDVSKMVEAQRKNIEALTQANQAAYAAVQELTKRQVEVLQETITEWQAAMAQGASGDSNSIARQTELAQKAISKTLTNMREMAEMAAKSQTAAWETMQNRFHENLAELKNLMQPPK